VVEPGSVMERLLRGVEHFERDVFPREREFFDGLAAGQQPAVLFITCADSRLLPNLFTNTVPGELFLSRHVGNLVPAYGGTMGGVTATIEYAVSVLGVEHVIVCGHTGCGAVRAMLEPDSVRDLPAVREWVRHAEAARRTVVENNPGASTEELVALLTDQNIVSQLWNLRTHPAVASGLASGRLSVHGWRYGVSDGSVAVFDETSSSFVAASSLLPDAGTPVVDRSKLAR